MAREHSQVALGETPAADSPQIMLWIQSPITRRKTKVIGLNSFRVNWRFAQVNQLRWTEQLGIETLYIEPSNPWQIGYAESFHRKLRDEFLAF